jgi:hypothetical protein
MVKDKSNILKTDGEKINHSSVGLRRVDIITIEEVSGF